jgi:hypothetical protein
MRAAENTRPDCALQKRVQRGDHLFVLTSKHSTRKGTTRITHFMKISRYADHLVREYSNWS